MTQSLCLHSGDDQYGRFLECRLGASVVRMRYIAEGEFTMGSPLDERGRREHEAQHRVLLTRPFWIAETTCTQGLWEEMMGNNPAWWKGEKRPVEQVSWDDTQEFIHTANTRYPSLGLRLPTEAEWEYSCRANTQTAFSFGDDITTEQVNFNGNYPYTERRQGIYRAETVNVRSLPANAWGLYEMHGNVWEWTQDFYQADLGTALAVDPKGAASGEFVVMRGACWFDRASVARCADRDIGKRTLRIPFLGFRVATDAAAPVL